jgi:hypothetical protein
VRVAVRPNPHFSEVAQLFKRSTVSLMFAYREALNSITLSPSASPARSTLTIGLSLLNPAPVGGWSLPRERTEWSQKNGQFAPYAAYLTRFHVTVAVPPAVADGVKYLNSSPVITNERFWSVLSQFGNVALSTRNVMLLSASLTT